MSGSSSRNVRPSLEERMHPYHHHRRDTTGRRGLAFCVLALLSMLIVISAGVAAASSGAGTLPASPVYLGATASNNWLQVEPARIVYTGDGSGLLGGAEVRDPSAGIKWSDWTDVIAHGTGFNQLDDCIPSCAGGTFHGFKVNIELWRARRLAGTLVFTRMTIFYRKQAPVG